MPIWGIQMLWVIIGAICAYVLIYLGVMLFCIWVIKKSMED